MAVKAKLNEDQQEAFRAIQKFIEHPAADTFVLKGYAGTGKTFLMQYLAVWLKEKNHKFSLLASTGRAATVLRGKTGLVTKTVHGELYQFKQVDGADDDLPPDLPFDQQGQMTLMFSLREPDKGKRIYIVDESSMLTNEMSDDMSMVNFGSGFLLDDLFAAVGNNKIIFVGDPGQLPPVKQLFSPALETKWLAKQRRTAIAVTLEKMERNSEDNDILELAAAIRQMSQEEYFPRFPRLPASNKRNVSLYSSDKELFKRYVEQLKNNGPESSIAIGRSNRMVDDINRAVRRDLFHQTDLPIQLNDILLVTHNNHPLGLTNGDFVIVREIKEVVIKVGLSFQKLLIKTLLSGEEQEVFVSLDILYGKESNFSKLQLRLLMGDFNDRMKQRNLKSHSEAYKESMMTDPYLNCLRAKYGYAVTCHKSQGGEWNEVFLFLEKTMYGMPPEELFRWWYTAVTRARIQLHLTNSWWIL